MAATNTIFVWKGTDKQRRNMQGEIVASSLAIAKAQLRKQGVAVKSVKKKPKPLFGSAKKIKPVDIAIFSRQMATMMKAGVPLVQSFDIVSEGVENESMRDLVTTIKNDVAAGGGLANAFEKHPKYFDDLFCSLVAAGENSGTLETMLDRVATYKEKTEQLKAKIKKALTYPIAVVVVAIIVTGILLVKVVPTFAETFRGFGADLPGFTLFVLGISEVVQKWWLAILIGIMASLTAFAQARRRSKRFSDWIDALSLKLPIIGGIVHDAVIARFSRTLSTTFAAGVPLVEALDSTAGAAGNAIYSNGIRRIRDDVTSGTSLYAAIRSTGLFPTLLLQMTSIGEESGSLDEMLGKVADQYEQQVDDAVDNMSALMEPIIMSVLGVLIGGLMIAMYLPIFMLGSVV
ncbi:type IV pilus biogenesis protein PilC [Luminiphilus syltensis NOR5-1B]|uniref:Type IV pilus biogenesis protein PilC n=1 Tax=Luminiphilus syltensis NOR5-1B TaxID=565045 RepID=B8KR38_9GAMM|nr:type II secretion system F family protein [Luminiphilus syltensis]EED36138.1 type IV pilus biogenesis protein PilC [Luminiphilus syltensis NOR5-1B]